jgi:DNA-binding NarL/FixJ family response regulator
MSDAGRITVLVAEREALLRRALRELVDSDAELTVVGEARDPQAVLRQAAALNPDIIVLGPRLVESEGASVAEQALDGDSNARIVAIFSSGESAVALLRAGAAGVVWADGEPEELTVAIRSVASGCEVLSARASREVIRFVREQPGRKPAPDPRRHGLSGREVQVVVSLAGGRSNSEISRDLRLSEPTVKSHLSRVMAKWQVRDRTQVLLVAARYDLVDISSGFGGEDPAGPRAREPVAPKVL